MPDVAAQPEGSLAHFGRHTVAGTVALRLLQVPAARQPTVDAARLRLSFLDEVVEERGAWWKSEGLGANAMWST